MDLSDFLKGVLLCRYDGPTLIELIDLLRPPPRPVDLPLRLSISDVFKTQAMGLASCLQWPILRECALQEAVWLGESRQVCSAQGLRFYSALET